jgi:hypothetical protein
MKKLFLSAMIIVAISGAAHAQEKKEIPDFANWVVESNIKTPREAVIKFYNEKQELIYQEKITGKKIKIEKPKVQKAFNDVLNQLLTKTRQVTDTALVLTMVKNW